MLIPNWKTVTTSLALLASLAAAFAALHQALMTSEQVELLQQQTLISQYTANAQMLGHPEIPVRIGAIHSLGLLAREQPQRFHIQVMKLLSAFIREPPEATPRQNQLRADVQAALDVIIYRDEKSLSIEEQHRRTFVQPYNTPSQAELVPIIDLRGSNLKWAELQRANFSYAVINGADLSYAHGHDANFEKASLLFVSAKATQLPSTRFDGANMAGADFSASQLQGSSFVETHMPWTMANTNLKESDLTRSIFAGTDLSGASLTNADISGATIQPGSLVRHIFDPTMPNDALKARCPRLTQRQLNSAIADPSNPPALLPQATEAGHCFAPTWYTEERGNAWKTYRASASSR